jgi:glycosyltransferase involved in cell wall biosynthesis
MATRLGIFSTHPIQYFAPLWRRLAATPGIDPIVYYFSDHSVRGGRDSGFGVNVAWDVPLLDGYQYEFITRDANLDRPKTVRIPDVDAVFDRGRFDAVLIQGYTHAFQRQVVRTARARHIRTVLCGDLTDQVPYGGRGVIRKLVREVYVRWFYQYIDAFGYVGENAREHLLRRGVSPQRMYFSPFSVDTQLFETQRVRFDRDSERATLAIEPEQFVLLFSGKLIPRKAPLLLLEALRRIPDRDRITLILIGDGELREQVVSLGREVLDNRIILPGFVNQGDLGKYFVAADAFVLPSEFETWGLVVNEAMQFGLPVIASTRVGSHRDLIVEGRTGHVFPAGDADGLASAIRSLSNLERRRAMGAAARDHVKRYSTEAAAGGLAAAVLGSSKLCAGQ